MHCKNDHHPIKSDLLTYSKKVNQQRDLKSTEQDSQLEEKGRGNVWGQSTTNKTAETNLYESRGIIKKFTST